MREEAIAQLKDRITQVLNRKNGGIKDFSRLSPEELVQEINIYYQELEFQNEELKRVSQNLEQVNKRYEDLFMNAPVGYVLYDENYKILSMNNLFKDLVVQLPENKSGLQSPEPTFDRFIASESQDTFYYHIRSLLTEKGPQKCRIQFKRQDKTWTFMMESTMTEEGVRKIFRSALLDISQEVILEKQLQQIRLLLEEKNQELQSYHDRLEGVMLAGNLAWWQMDVPTGKVSFNENKTKMLGYDPLNFTHYSHFTDLVHPDDHESIMQSMRDYLEGRREVYGGVYRIKTKGGAYKWFQDIGLATAWNADGKPLALSGVVFDVTTLKNAEEEALRASKVKSEFLANMSHEIRTPLNAVIGFTDLLREASLTAEQREYLDNANNSAHSLLEIINDILDFSKIEAGRLELEEVSWDLETLLDQTIKMFKFQGDKKGISLNLAIPASLPARVVIDPVRCKQVLVNLLSNALKFTERGSVTLEVDFEPVISPSVESPTGTFTFRVKDTGIGIPEDQKDRLFKAFSQGDTSITRRFGGTGLGLVISSNLVAKMGGVLEFDSVVGKGSTFYFSITKAYVPVVKEDEHKGPAIPDKMQGDEPFDHFPEDPFRVLIVEDVTLNRKLAEIIIRRLLPRAEFFGAPNGQEGVDLFSQIKPDVVLMDIQMPVMDGYTATAAIRSLEAEHNSPFRVPIIGLSAGAMEEEIKQAYDSGMDFYITKPIESDQLKKTLFKVLNIRPDAKPKALAPKGTMPSLTHFDKDGLLQRLGGDRELYPQMVAMSFVQFTEYKNDLAQAIEEGDFERARHVAHKFKGSALTMSCIRLSEILGLMEKKEADDAFKFEALMEAVDQEFVIVSNVMRSET